MAVVSDIEIRLRADIARLQQDMTQARRVVTETQDRINAAANAMKTALAGIGLGAGLAEVIKMADEYAKFTAQLRLASTSQADFAASYADVKRVAKESQQDLASTGVLYARIANGTRELGTTQKQVAAITETVNLALRVSGATAVESASAQLQLSQAFASGTLRGEEFNAVNEAAPRLMKALADGMGKPVGALKAMATEGLITSKIMAEVLPKALDSLREESSKIQTISGSFTVLKNEMLEFFGAQAQANGTVAIITTSIGYLAEHLDALVTVLKTAMAYQIGTWLATWTTKTYAQVTASVALRAATMVQMQAEVTAAEAQVALLAATQAAIVMSRNEMITRLGQANANIRSAEAAIAAASAAGAQSYALMVLRNATAELAVAEAARVAMLAELAILGQQQARVSAQITAADTAQAAAKARLAGATGILAGAMRGLSAATAFLGGPIGAIILAIGALMLAWQLFAKKSKEANAEVAESFDEAHKRIIKQLDEQIQKQENLLQLKNAGMTTAQAEKQLPIVLQLAAASKQMQELNARAGDFSRISNDDAILKRIELGKQITELLQKQEKATTGAAAVEKMSIAERVKGLKTEMATREEKRLAELKAIEDLKGKTADYDDLVARINEKYKDNKAEGAVKKEQQAYVTLITSIREKIETGKLENATDLDAAEGQKLRIKFEQMLIEGKLKMSAAHQIAARSALDELDQVEKLAKAHLSEKEVKKYIEESTLARQDSIASLEAEYRMAGKSSDARELAMIEVKEQANLEKFLLQARLANRALTDPQIAKLKEEAAARVTVEQATLAQTKALNYASQLAAENKRFAAEALFDEKDRAAALLRIDAAMWQERIALAGEGTEAQKRLQEEYSTWYKNQLAKPEIEASKKMWESIDSTAHDAFTSIFDSGKSAFDRLRDTLKSGLLDLLYQMTIKKWILSIGASVSGGASGLASAGDIASLGGSGGGGGMGSIANLAQGAKTAYTIATQGFSGVAAGIGGSIATLGNIFGSSAVSAFGTGMGLTGAQAAAASAAYGSAGMASTGSALTAGAAAAPLVAAAAGIAAGVLGGKLISGQYGSTATVVGGTGVGAVAGAFLGGPIGAAIGGAIGGVIGGLANRAFGMGDKKYGETGITGTLSGNSFTGNEYAKWTQKGGWFRSDKADTDRKAVDASTSNAFVETYAAIRNVSATLAGVIGADTSALANRAQALNINLTGLTTDADRLAAVTKFFEGVGNTIAVELVPNLAQFQVQGEALSTTLQRVSQNYAGVDAALQLIGRTSQEAFGAVGVSSIAAREALIKMAGGLDALSSGTAYFAENFLTIDQQMAPVIESVNKSLAALGMSGVKTTAQYADAVMKLTSSGALATESGQELYLQLLALAPAFKAVTDHTQKLNGSLEERIKLQDAIDKLTLTSEQLRAKERATIGAGNLALYDQLQALNDLAAARTSETDRLKAVAESTKAFAQSLNTALSSLSQGSLSTLTPLQKLADAQGRYQQTLAAAKAGDATAQGNLTATAQAFLTASQVVNASSARYAADAARVQAELAALAAAAVGKQTEAERQLTLLTAQADGILKVNESVNLASTSIVTAIDNLRATGYATPYSTAPMGNTPSTAPMGGPDNVALANALTAVQQELAAMRAEAAQNAAHIADTVALSSASNASTITQGTKDAAMSQVYAEQLAPTVA